MSNYKYDYYYQAFDEGYVRACDNWSDTVENLILIKGEEYTWEVTKDNAGEYYMGYREALIDLLDIMKVEHSYVHWTMEGLD